MRLRSKTTFYTEFVRGCVVFVYLKGKNFNHTLNISHTCLTVKKHLNGWMSENP